MSINIYKKKIKTILLLLILHCQFQLTAQNLCHTYPDDPSWNPGGYGNAVYDSKSDTYFLIEFMRVIWIDSHSALHIKQVDTDGNLLNSRYIVTNLLPYSGHYIPTAQIQDKELVIFYNRHMGFPKRHDVFMIRLHTNLNQDYTCERLFINNPESKYNSIKVNETAKYGDKIILTGSVLDHEDFSGPATESALFMGVVLPDGTFEYSVFEGTIPSERIEGLSLYTDEKSEAVYVSSRYHESFDANQVPLILRFKLINDKFLLEWSKVYPGLKVDLSNYSNYNKGIEIPIIGSYSNWKLPAFVARDYSGENLVLVPFYTYNGFPLSSRAVHFTVPIDAELIDADNFGKTDNGLVALFNREEESNYVNSQSFLFSCNNVYDKITVGKLHDLNSPIGVHSMIARTLMKKSDEMIAIGGISNTVNLDFMDAHRATLMQSDNNLSFGCVSSETLLGVKSALVYSENLSLVYVNPGVQKEHSIILNVHQFDPYSVDLCVKFEGKAPDHSDSNKMGVNTDFYSNHPIYPNPANNRINIPIPAAEGETTLTILDMAGKLIYKEIISGVRNVQVDVHDFEVGIYSMKLSNNLGVIQTDKIIVSR